MNVPTKKIYYVLQILHIKIRGHEEYYQAYENDGMSLEELCRV